MLVAELVEVKLVPSVAWWPGGNDFMGPPGNGPNIITAPRLSPKFGDTSPCPYRWYSHSGVESSVVYGVNRIGPEIAVLRLGGQLEFNFIDPSWERF